MTREPARCARAGYEYHPAQKANRRARRRRKHGRDATIGAGGAATDFNSAGEARRVGGPLSRTARTAPRALLAAELARAKDEGRGQGTLAVGDRELLLSKGSRDGWWRLETADFEIVIDEGAHLEGWILTVKLRAMTLAACGPDRCVALAEEVAAQLLHLIDGQRVARFDLCVDVVGFDVDGIDTRQWVTSGRASVQRRAPHDAESRREWFTGGERVAFYVGRSDVVLRVYDKTTELQNDHVGVKRSFEHARWREARWDGISNVTRVEFQLRGDVLKQLDEGRARDPAQIASRRNAIWKYLTRTWCRLCTPSGCVRRTRWRSDPRWLAVQEVTFEDETGEVSVRRRIRGAPSAEYIAGMALAHAAKTGMLDGIALPSSREIEQWSPASARTFVHEKLGALLGAVGAGQASSLLNRRGARGAAVFVVERLRAARAKASSIVPHGEDVGASSPGTSWWSTAMD